ncbi:UDP-N-acetylglucosamine 2-epimerase [Desulfovibrio legallii]|uniref:UDP-N-acetylglucosamine 2-epimerase (Non-hydrolysing)/GDP/UDP-N,N'-diacetylbacillosamine 2-epimerase (Hydrolysing) n=1 Tax=Desulfovibrio legallii TaxID=571438 RepID=A0A1G7J8C0_9BACT|nr:UDP-N-acetylglucosamine 2-epimerase [Desulfovibrio legallii]SDF21034.1 UDP-N-acetylglucosamine 2-epimerase (non-hydrolysing)/GDP/UDP-N,N'-diacetylbacillosamine 2-epimerase (hydrolysing) [Desulfovibrio legallii]
MRTIAVFTATRAEYGLLRPVLSHLRASACHLHLLVSGTHLSRKHGYTLTEITKDGFVPDVAIPLDLTTDASEHLCQEIGRLITAIGEALAQIRPDLFVVLGDRYECLGATLAAAMMHVPTAHLYGGEVTRGAMDDGFRHAITKLSHLHFTSCEPYRRRIIQLGEQPDHVWNVGALGVENALNLPLLDIDATHTALGLPPGASYILCTFHPVTLEPGQEIDQLTALRKALDLFPHCHIVFTGANADSGGYNINQYIEHYAAAYPERVRFFQSLGTLLYLSAARHALCVAGNSSSGIIEVPSLGVPVVNIGHRQEGRIVSSAVLHCEPREKAIAAALAQTTAPERRALAKNTPNPYEKNGTSDAIAHTLLTFPLKGILKKMFYDMARN